MDTNALCAENSAKQISVYTIETAYTFPSWDTRLERTNSAPSATNEAYRAGDEYELDNIAADRRCEDIRPHYKHTQQALRRERENRQRNAEFKVECQPVLLNSLIFPANGVDMEEFDVVRIHNARHSGVSHSTIGFILTGLLSGCNKTAKTKRVKP
jgi:hypothetical protein